MAVVRQTKGFFKGLKPQIEIHLREELRILESVVSSLEMNRTRYALQKIPLVNLFQEIRGDLAREIDLTAEQEYLDEASILYDGVARVLIPELAPFCTRTTTSMEYIDAIKIT